MPPALPGRTLADKKVQTSAAIDEELWFGTYDSSEAEKAAATSMAATAGAVIGAKPFPASAKKLAELSSKEDTSTQQYVDVLEQDAALSVKLLRVVNSAGYGLRQRCASVRHAVTIVGSKHLHQIATTAAVLDLFDSDSAMAVAILEHSAVVGGLCRYLGAHLALPTEDLFTIGVLHDIGKIMMLETFGDRYGALLEQANGRFDALFELERLEYGFDHGILAAHVLKVWSIPDPVPKVIAWHHEPGRALGSSSANATLVQVLRLADEIVYEMPAGREGIARVAGHPACGYLDISEAQLGAMWDELAEIQGHALEQRRNGDDAGRVDKAEGSALRPRGTASQAPKSAAGLPKQFPCIECSRPSFGTTCPACGGHLCEAHPVGASGWCGVCAKEYAVLAARAPILLQVRTLVAGAVLTVILAGLYGWLSSGQRGALAATLVSAVSAMVLLLVGVILRRSVIRASVVRSRRR